MRICTHCNYVYNLMDNFPVVFIVVFCRTKGPHFHFCLVSFSDVGLAHFAIVFYVVSYRLVTLCMSVCVSACGCGQVYWLKYSY